VAQGKNVMKTWASLKRRAVRYSIIIKSMKKQAPPPCFLLSIKAEKLELGVGLCPQAENNLNQACLLAGHLLQNPDIKSRLQKTTIRHNFVWSKFSGSQ